MGMTAPNKTTEKILIALLMLLLVSPAYAETSEASERINRTICQPICLVYMVAGAIGALVLLFFGLKYLQSGDDEEQRSNVKIAIIAVFVGILIIACSVPLVNYVIIGLLPSYECDCTKAFGSSGSNKGDITISDIHVETI